MTLGSINQMGQRRNLRQDIQVPSVVEELLKRLAGRLSEGYEDGDPDRIVEETGKEIDDFYGDGNHAKRIGHSPHDPFNMIPSSSTRRGCTELLITFCCNNDSFEKRLLESLDHVSQHCRNTKDIYFITTKWNSTVFEKYEGYLDMIRALPVNIVFIYVGKEGFVRMPD